MNAKDDQTRNHFALLALDAQVAVTLMAAQTGKPVQLGCFVEAAGRSRLARRRSPGPGGPPALIRSYGTSFWSAAAWPR